MACDDENLDMKLKIQIFESDDTRRLVRGVRIERDMINWCVSPCFTYPYGYPYTPAREEREGKPPCYTYTCQNIVRISLVPLSNQNVGPSY